jgi:hypothetical protein
MTVTVSTQQVTIFRQPGRYGGWPANYGIWSWGDEIVAGFTIGYHSDEGRFHARDKARPFINMQARSLDGSQSWTVEDFPGARPGGRGLSADEHMNPGLHLAEVIDRPGATQPSPGGFDLSHPDFGIMGARAGLTTVRSFFYITTDRACSWQGPYDLPLLGQSGVHARTDYVIEAPDRALLFLTGHKDGVYEGRSFCARISDGGLTFDFVSFIGPEPEPGAFAIMPASLRLPDDRLLVAVRCRAGDRKARHDVSWIDLYRSDDLGASWQHLNRPANFHEQGHNGNPGTLNRLPDGRLVLIYGNRDKPARIAARLSGNDGDSWSDEIVLRAGGGNYDIGYPRTVVRPDGVVVTVYYFNDRPDGQGERFIEATIWRPD